MKLAGATARQRYGDPGRRAVDKAQSETGTVPKVSYDRYVSPDWLKLEKERLFPRVWQVACREEEIPNPGDYVAYDVADRAIVVIRTQNGEIKAHHNVCRHRGRKLVSGCGRIKQFHCNYHGWNYDLDGRNTYVQDPEDWGPALACEDLSLKSVRVDTWGGFVWVDLREDGESLAEYLETIPQLLGPFEYEKMRYRWYVTLHLPCNWKVAVEAFMEAYHVAATHPQILPLIGDDRTTSAVQGKHAHVHYPHQGTPIGMPSPRLGQPWPDDKRKAMIQYFDYYEYALKAMFSERDARAAQALTDVLPKDADVFTVIGTAIELGRKAAEADGVGYPEGVTMEHMGQAGAVWSVFPNCATLPYFDGALWYRSRPRGDDPAKCVFDIFSLVRYAPGTEPPLVRQLFTEENLAQNTAGEILNQDMANMAEVQKGMRSGAIAAAIVNPVQEMAVINFAHHLDRYLAQP
jgi:phenylpropionate dioxygenase-like ring-hydroxylating dioxygenase large terminal subunit